MTAPTIGPPIGVEPWKATNQSDMTRPRIAGSERSCNVALPTDMNTTEPAPTNVMAISSRARVGAMVARVIAMPYAVTEITSSRAPVRPRVARTSPPTTAPIPMAAVMKP
jgi:hypothetical protein